MADHAPTTRSSIVTPLWVCAGLAAVMALALATWLTRAQAAAGMPGQFIAALLMLAFNAIPVSGWLIAAWGYGALLRRALSRSGPSLWARPGTPDSIHANDHSTGTLAPASSGICAEPCPDLHLDFGLGVAAMLWLDHALGAAGVLQIGGSTGAWVLLCVGWLLALLSLRERIAARTLSMRMGGWSGLALLGAVPATTVLIIATTSAPGWLWGSEAAGYDVLEYHLQMPREWLAAGLLTPLRHDVYSFAPSYVEAAYYHLAVLLNGLATRPLNGAVEAATACQLLHACLMLWAAREVMLLARRFVSHWMALGAGAIAISVPWVVVTGSMAYDEAVLIGLLALCWRLVEARSVAWRSFVLIGFLAGIACGAKLTAVGGVVLPIGVLLLVRLSPGQWWRMVVGCCAGGLIALGPYLIRNYVALDGANPLFPFLANTLGSAHWTSEQVARWNGAHTAHEPWAARLATLWEMGFVYGQWAGLWFVALAAAPVAWMNRQRRSAVRDSGLILLVQVGFWLALTHLQSRFLLPCLPALVMVIAMGLDVVLQRWRRGMFAMSIALPAALGAWCIHLYGQQQKGQPAACIDGLVLRTGVDVRPLDRANAQNLAANNSDVFLNLFTDPGQGLYLLGDATPLYILRPVVWHSTWDTSPLGQIIRAHGDDQDAWTAALLDRGISLVLVNYSELDRLVNKDHWYDPIFADVDVRGYFDAHAQRVAQWGPRVLYQLIEPSK